MISLKRRVLPDYPIEEPIATTFKAGIQHNDEPVRVLARAAQRFDYDVTQNRLIIYDKTLKTVSTLGELSLLAASRCMKVLQRAVIRKKIVVLRRILRLVGVSSYHRRVMAPCSVLDAWKAKDV